MKQRLQDIHAQCDTIESDIQPLHNKQVVCFTQSERERERRVVCVCAYVSVSMYKLLNITSGLNSNLMMSEKSRLRYLYIFDIRRKSK